MHPKQQRQVSIPALHSEGGYWGSCVRIWMPHQPSAMPRVCRDSISLLDSLVSWMHRMSACKSLSTFERPQTLLLSIGRRPLTFHVIMRRALALTGGQTMPVFASISGMLSGGLLLSLLQTRLSASHASFKQCSFPQVKAALALPWKLKDAQTPFASPQRAHTHLRYDVTDTT